jgi:hypothetical protein
MAWRGDPAVGVLVVVLGRPPPMVPPHSPKSICSVPGGRAGEMKTSRDLARAMIAFSLIDCCRLRCRLTQRSLMKLAVVGGAIVFGVPRRSAPPGLRDRRHSRAGTGGPVWRLIWAMKGLSAFATLARVSLRAVPPYSAKPIADTPTPRLTNQLRIGTISYR